jgi:hypothetical protein
VFSLAVSELDEVWMANVFEELCAYFVAHVQNYINLELLNTSSILIFIDLFRRSIAYSFRCIVNSVMDPTLDTVSSSIVR